MKTLILAAVAALAIGAATARANSEGLNDGGFYRAPPAAQQQPKPNNTAPASSTYSVQSQVHDAWRNNGLDGGGG
jgi:hypothetical protein